MRKCYKLVKGMFPVRKLLSLMTLLLVCVLLPVMASADDLYEWNRSCRRKTICTTKVFSGGDTTRVIATIPANTYVKVHGATDQWADISYKTASGKSGRGLADPDCIGSAVISFTDANGDRRGIQELQYYEMYGNNPPPGGVLDKPLPGGNGETVGKPDSSGETESAEKNTSSAGNTTSKKTAATKKNTKSTAPAPNADILWQGEKVEVRTLGVVSSMIVADGAEQNVPTAELQFSGDAGEDRRIASILAPRTGKCSLREKASDKADVITKCKAGTVVQVLEYGKSYCRVVCEGQMGYVQTACLTFLDPAAEIMGTTVLTYNGRATGSAQVPVRNTASNDSSMIAKLRSGTEVAVLGKTGKWYEVAYEGMHGFVHENYMSEEIK